MKKQRRWKPSLIMASFMWDFSCPRLWISVGSNTPMFPLGTIMYLEDFKGKEFQYQYCSNHKTTIQFREPILTVPWTGSVTNVFCLLKGKLRCTHPSLGQRWGCLHRPSLADMEVSGGREVGEDVEGAFWGRAGGGFPGVVGREQETGLGPGPGI